MRGTSHSMYFLVACYALVLLAVTSVESTAQASDRSAKVFMVRLQNTPCQIGSNNGTCYLKQQCIDRGGESVGKCQDGLGTCCKFVLGCSNTSNYRTITEKEVVIKDNKECHYEFTKIKEYCQLKIEIISLYSSPTVDGDCEGGTMTIEDSVTVNNFPICGTVNRPLYASFGQSSRITLSFARGSDESSSNYEIKVTHIRCDARERVPDHCLVEYGGRTGKIQNFGFDKAWIANQHYNACVRKSGTSIKWNKCDRTGTMWDTDTRKGPIPSKDFIMSKYWGVFGSFGDNCAEGTSYVAMSGNRYCGNQFPNSTTSTDEPFFLTVNLKKDEDGFSKLPTKLVVWPSHKIDGTCMDTAPATPADPNSLNPGAFFNTEKCTPVMSQITTDIYFECACPKDVSPPGVVDHTLTGFSVGFCLEYTQS